MTALSTHHLDTWHDSPQETRQETPQPHLPSGESPFAANPESISAEEIHHVLTVAHRIGARARLRFVRGLLALHRTGLFVKLGFSTTAQYASSEFGYQKTEVYESLRVADSLEELPRCTSAFEAGKLSWSALKEVTRVATADTEEEWLRFAAKQTFEELRAEVLDARKKNRKTPRKNGYGLPHLRVKITLDLEPEEHALLEKAVEKVATELGGSLDGEKVRPRHALLYLAERALQEPPEPEACSGTDGAAGSASPFTVLYRVCPTCRVSHVATPNGYVEIAEDAAARVEGEARKVEIPIEAETPPRPDGLAGAPDLDSEPPENDAPNSAALTRRVLLRDGACCSNPHCGRRENLHAHHIRFRSRGGRTALWNEVLVCDRCHACIHLGFLTLDGDPADGLEWRPAVRALDPACAVGTGAGDELASLPVVVAQGVPGFRSSGIPESPQPPTIPARQLSDRYGPTRALRQLGYDAATAARLAAQAHDALVNENSANENSGNESSQIPGKEPDENAVFNLAIRIGRSFQA